MTILFKAWGLDGSLTSANNFDRVQSNGQQQNTPFDFGILEDRANVVSVDGYSALLMRRHVGDPETSAAVARSEVLDLDTPQYADWTLEDGYDANESYRWYRACFMLPASFPTAFLATEGAWAMPFQLATRPDTSPVDSVGTPSLAVAVKRDNYGALRFALFRNNDPDTASAVSDPAVHSQEICSWPYRTGEWQDILVHVRWSWSTDGEMTVWRNRRPVLVESGVGNAPNNAPIRGGGGPYPKLGIYSSNDEAFDVYHRGLIIGDHAAIFADMYPELTSAVPLERVSGPVGVMAS